MKYFTLSITAILFFVSSNILAHNIDSVYIFSDTLKNHQTYLTTPWLYQSGDDSSWSKIDYDDSDWDTLNSVFYIDEISSEKWTGIGWFRRVIVIDSLLINKSIALRLYHYGASDIFWNGKLINSFGTVGADTSLEKNYQPNGIPIVIDLDSTIANTFAIRYSNQKSIYEKKWMTRWFRAIGFTAAISDVNLSFKELILQGRLGAAINFGIIGLFFSLSALYFFLFIFYARRVENLYYSLFNFFTSLFFIAIYLGQGFYISLTVSMIFKSLMALSLAFIFLF